MFYYENSRGEIVGRLYEAGAGWVAEIGRISQSAVSPFVAESSARFKTHRQAERHLKERGLVSAVV